MNSGKVFLAAVLLTGCSSGGGVANQVGAISASPTARSFGVASYVVTGSTVTLHDQYGMELGQVTVTSPDGDNRLFTAELVDGTTDVVEVYRPMGDGRFIAPITPETLLMATLADTALTPTWAAHQVRFTLNDRHAGPAALAPEDSAGITACTSYSCSGSGCTPLGCAKPANTSLGCTNPSQLGAYTGTDNRVWQDSYMYGLSQSTCLGNFGSKYCATAFGGAAKDYSVANGSLSCTFYNPDGSWVPYCKIGTTSNTWVASCPRVSCGTSGDYDAVPRLGACDNPGSCTYSQGTVGCTTYH